MCGLFGMFEYGNEMEQSEINNIITSLGYESCERGTDATGIAYVNKNRLEVVKAPKPAFEFKFKLPSETNIAIGHTRLTTQGKENKNKNNHPFPGRVNGLPFALAHNGIIHNDKKLRAENKLPNTEVETDSYIAVQLLEKDGQLNPESIGRMAEKLEGSFCFTILDGRKNLYFVKGDNPLAIIHDRSRKPYFYASTEEILWKSLIGSNLFTDFKRVLFNDSSAIEEISLKKGDILTIRADGAMETAHFKPQETYCVPYRWDTQYSFLDMDEVSTFEDEYIEQLRDAASYLGWGGEFVDNLLDEGFSLDEVEEYIYTGY